MISNAREWIEEYATEYRKKSKLIKVVDKLVFVLFYRLIWNFRIDVKFNNAFKAKRCAFPESSRSLGAGFEDDYYDYEIDEAMAENDPAGSSMLSLRGKKTVDPIEKALKFKKGLDRYVFIYEYKVRRIRVTNLAKNRWAKRSWKRKTNLLVKKQN